MKYTLTFLAIIMLGACSSTPIKQNALSVQTQKAASAQSELTTSLRLGG